MNLQNCHNRRFDIICLWIRCIVDINGEPSSRNLDNRRSIEILRKLFCLKRCRRYDNLQIRPFQAQILDQGQNNIRMKWPFMGLVYNHTRIRTQQWISHELPQQHTVGHVLNDSVFGSVVFEPDRIPNFFTQLALHFLGDSGSHWHGSDSSWLCTSDFLVVLSVTDFMKVLGQLGCFPRTGLTHHYDDLVVLDKL